MSLRADEGGFLKGREVVRLLQGRVDPQVVQLISRLADEAGGAHKAIKELATMFDQLTKIVSDFTQVAKNLKDAQDKLVGERGIMSSSKDEQR